MTTITTRSGKGSPLTNNEVDANFTNLNDDKVEASGDSMTGNLSFGDDNKAIFGAGSDLEIYHDGSNSYIKEKGNGVLNISGGNAINFLTGNDAAETGLTIGTDGAVTAYYDNTARLATTSTGIDVTGTAGADTLEASTASGGLINITRDDPTIGTNNSLGAIYWNSTEDSGTTVNQGAAILALADQNHSTIASGSRLSLQTTAVSATTPTERLRISAGGDITFYDTDGSTASFVYDASAGLTINEAGADRDFRVESNNKTHALFVDASTDKVFIGGNGTSDSDVATVNATNQSTWASSITEGILGLARYNNTQTSGQKADLFFRVTTDNSSRNANGSISLVQPTTNSNHSNFQFNLRHGNGTRYNHMTLDGQAGAVFNDTGQNFDFRVESDNNANMLFVDAGTDRVGVGVSDPQAELFVRKDTAGPARLGISNAGTVGPTTSARLAFYEGNTETSYIERRRDGSGDTAIVTPAADNPVNIEVNGGNELASFKGSSIIFNENSGDQDFRVESDGNTHMLFVDAGNNRVQFGKSSGGNTQTAGVEIQATGFVGIAGSGIRPLQINRLTDHGDIIELRQANSTVLSLGSSSGSGFIADDDTGLFFNRASNNILPYRNDSGNEGPYTNAIDLGRSTARFKDAYFRSVDITHDSDRGRIRLYANASLGSEMRIFNANGYGLISMINDHPLNFHTNNTERLELSSSATVFNDVSADVDFRVETNTQAYAFFVDSSSNRVGIGIDVPNASLGIRKNAANSSDANPVVRLQSATAGDELLLRAQGLDDSSVARYADIAFLGDNTNEKIEFRAPYNTTSPQLILDSDNGVIMNEGSSGTRDFRVESDNISSMLMVDAGQDEVYVGGVVDLGASVMTVKAGTGAHNSFAVGPGGNNSVTIGNFTSNDTIANLITSSSKFGGVIQGGENGSLVLGIRDNDITDGVFIISGTGTGGGQMSNDYSRLKFSVTPNIVVINETGDDSDFRVESDSNSHMLFVDAGNNRIGIGKAPLTNVLDVSTSMNIEGDASPSGNGLALGDYGTTGAYKWIQSFNSQPLRLNPLGNEVSIGVSGTGANFKAFGSAVFNEDGGSTQDFRVESDNYAHMLFVDAGNDKVAIRNSSAINSGALSVNGSISFNNQTAGTYNHASGFIDFTDAGDANLLRLHAGADPGEYSKIEISTNIAGSQSDAISVENTGPIVINQDSVAARDFRVESDSNTTALYVDAGNDRTMFGRVDVSSGEDFCAIDAKPATSGHVIRTGRDDNSTKNHIVFINPNGTVGSIQTAASATLFNTSSDARLKENIADSGDAGELIDAIQVRQFDWIADGEHQRYGMVAQELNTVAPEAVSEGETEDDMMAVDYSKLVPMLVKEIQSLRARVAQLESN